MRIGFFDSGVGGITVLKEAIKLLPCEDFLYYADTRNAPYGTKSKNTVRGYIFNAVEFIAQQDIKALVVACNTATSIAISDLRSRYGFPILGMEPAVKPAVESCQDKRVLVLATPLTLKEEKFQNLVARVDREHVVDALPLPELVEFAENYIFDRQTILKYLSEKLSPFDVSQYGTVVLGCTHFPYFRSHLQSLFPPDTHIIDGSTGTVKHLYHILESNHLLKNCGKGEVIFYSSDKAVNTDYRFRRYLDLLLQAENKKMGCAHSDSPRPIQA